MYKEFVLDLKAMRQKSGLSQEDCAHLIGSAEDIISRIERGTRKPTIEEICTLQLLYDASFKRFYAHCLTSARRQLTDNLKTLPLAKPDRKGKYARELFLEHLATRLAASLSQQDG
ncbi:helix-turn-helix domain-containing protein [Salipiger sp. P9]|uniref:helix-turn-helix domain-containing protein n=1 Tax=Salipiger pentaromativorans TaxID=2943193 RepID=UPI0021575FA9|nr:helix-turn-helix domain-containing protein [Salipiger pentaromativorans]MCR8551165.1 helix-turn-helix domain-containing protein [Salipiger pentaromativorans]